MQYDPGEGIEFLSSHFNRALSEGFDYQGYNPSKALIIAETELDLDWLSHYFPELTLTYCKRDEVSWQTLKRQVDEAQPDLVVMPRLAFEAHKDFKHSLGVYVEAFSQYLEVPLLLINEQIPRLDGPVLLGFESIRRPTISLYTPWIVYRESWFPIMKRTFARSWPPLRIDWSKGCASRFQMQEYVGRSAHIVRSVYWRQAISD